MGNKPMNCFLYDFLDNEELNKFLNNNGINQQNYMLKDIYSDILDFEYYYIVCEENSLILGAMPFILYRNELGNIVHSMPFIGYGGIAALDDNRKNIFKCILNFLQEFCKRQEVVIINICTPPFEGSDYDLYREILNPDYEMKNFYQYLNLEEDIFGNMKSKFRNNLKRNLKKFKEHDISIIENNSLEFLGNWYDNIYIKRLKQTGCTIYPFKVFQEIISKLNVDKYKMIYAILDGKIIGGGLYLKQKNSLDNFMRVIDTDYLYTQAGTALDYYSIVEAKKMNVKYYNWQSCDKIGSSIYKYKEEWGSKLDYHHYITKIVGDISLIKNTSINDIKRKYKGLYVMPYEIFSKEY